MRRNIDFLVVFCKGFAAKEPLQALRGGQHPRPLRLLTAFASTSPKGRGLGKEMKLAWTAKGSPFGRAVTAGD